MNHGTGLSVCGGIAIGPAIVWRGRHSDTPLSAGTPKQELIKFYTARKSARQQLAALYEIPCRTVGEHEASILEICTPCWRKPTGLLSFPNFK